MKRTMWTLFGCVTLLVAITFAGQRVLLSQMGWFAGEAERATSCVQSGDVSAAMDVIAGIAAAWDAEEMTLRALLDHGRVHDIAMLIACAKSLGIDDAPDMLIVCAQLRLSFISIANEEKLSIQNIF